MPFANITRMQSCNCPKAKAKDACWAFETASGTAQEIYTHLRLDEPLPGNPSGQLGFLYREINKALTDEGHWFRPCHTAFSLCDDFVFSDGCGTQTLTFIQTGFDLANAILRIIITYDDRGLATKVTVNPNDTGEFELTE